MNRTFFVTGTDTGVGKTLVANALLKLAQEEGLSTLGLKPVAAGCYLRDNQSVNEDAWELMQHSSIDISYSDVNPVALREPMAPHIAAEREGTTLAAQPLAEHCTAQAARADFCVIEGAGGWQVPLNDSESMADIATRVGAPVVLVVGMRLGCINHSLLTAAAIAAAGLELAGWVANHIDADMAVTQQNVAAVDARIAAPLLGEIPVLDNPGPVFAIPHLTVSPLLQSTS